MARRAFQLLTTVCLLGLSALPLSVPTVHAAADPAAEATQATPQYQNQFPRATVVSIGRSEDGKHLTITLLLENVSDQPERLAYQRDSALAVDDTGTAYTLTAMSGVNTWRGGDPTSYSKPYAKFTVFFPKSRATLVFAFASKTPGKGQHVSFSANFYGAVKGERTDMSIGLFNISVD